MPRTSPADPVDPALATSDAPRAEQPAGAERPAKSKEKISAYISGALAESVRDAVAALGSHVEDPRSLSDFFESAMSREVDRLQRERNNGQAFPQRAHRQLVAGRRAD